MKVYQFPTVSKSMVLMLEKISFISAFFCLLIIVVMGLIGLGIAKIVIGK